MAHPFQKAGGQHRRNHIHISRLRASRNRCIIVKLAEMFYGIYKAALSMYNWEHPPYPPLKEGYYAPTMVSYELDIRGSLEKSLPIQLATWQMQSPDRR